MSEYPSNLSRQQVISLAVLLGLLLVGLSVMATYTTYHWLRGDYAVKNLNAASMTCEKRIDEYFGDREVIRYYDGHSSFYERETGDFVVFYKVDAHSFQKPYPVHEHLVKCVIMDSFGFVKSFEAYDHGPASPS